MDKKLFVVASLVVIASLVLAACAPAAAPTPVVQVVKETVVVAGTPVVKETTKEVVVTATPAPTAKPAPGAALPRNETMYFNGQQWGAVVCWNPYSVNCNNAMAVNQQDSARVTMFETPYLYDMLDGKVYPLLADGPWAWDAGMTTITFKI